MPTYHIAVPDGREYDIESEHELTAAQVAALVPPAPSATPEPGAAPVRGRTLLNRFRKGGAEGVGQSLRGLARLGYAIGQAAGLESDVTPEMREARLRDISPAFRLGTDLIEGAQDAFPTDPARDRDLASVLASAAGQMVPTLASGFAGPAAGAIQYGLAAGEQQAQEATDAGRPDLATKTFLLTAPLGALTEGLLGVAPRFAGRLARPAGGVARKLVEGAAREGTQEGLEQVGQNVIASDVAGYDPNRPITQDVGLSMAAGALLGGPVHAAPSIAHAIVDRFATKPDSRELAKPVDLAPGKDGGASEQAPPAPAQGEASESLPPSESVSGPVALFRGPHGEEFEAELGTATLEQVQELMFRTHPGVEFVGMRGGQPPSAGSAPEAGESPAPVPPEPAGGDQPAPGLAPQEQSQSGPGIDEATGAPSAEPASAVEEASPSEPTPIPAGPETPNPQLQTAPGTTTLVTEPAVPDTAHDVREGTEAARGVTPDDQPMAATAGVNPQTAGSNPPSSARSQAARAYWRSLEHERPPTFIDWVAANVGQIRSHQGASKMRGEYDAEAYRRFRATAWGRKLISRKGGTPVDVAAQAAFNAGVLKEPTADAFWEAAEASAASIRDYYRTRGGTQARILREEAAQAAAFAQAQRPAKGRVQIDPDELHVGDSFEVKGEPFTVTDVEWDEDGRVTSLVVKDGPRFGIQRVEAPIQADKGTLKKRPPTIFAYPDEDPFAAPSDPNPPVQSHEPAGAFLDDQSTPPPAAEAAADAAEARAREALNPKPKGMHIPEGRSDISERGFINPTILADLVVAGARLLRRLGRRLASRSRWAAGMVKAFGERVGKYLSQVWDRIARIGTGVTLRLSPEALGQRNLVEDLAGNTNIAPEERPLYGPDVLLKGQPSIVRALAPKSVQIRMLGSEALLRAKQRKDLVEATQTAAVRQQSEALRKELVATAQRSHPSGWWLPNWLIGTRRAKHFMDRALHIAARLNPTGRDAAGNFVWGDFRQRMGFITPRMFAAGGHSVGDTISWTNPTLGTTETVTIGNQVRTAEGRPVYQLHRDIPATVQQELYDHYQTEFPDLMWFVDMFIDPALRDTRVTHNGVEIPVFNRLALAAMMADGHPEFQALEAYTPDVLVTRSLLGAIRGALSFSGGVRSPGRRYKTGASRESGSVRDLLSGFNIRTAQMLRERSRREWMQAVLRAATPIQRGTVPEGWVKLERGMEDLWQAVQRLRNWRSPVDPATGNPIFPQTEARMADDGSPEWQAFFGEAARLRGRQLMLPERLVRQLSNQFKEQKVRGMLFRLGKWAVRNSTRLFLVAPTTYVANVLTNDLFTLEAATRYTLSGLLSRNARDLRFARNLLQAEVAGRFMGLREAIGLGDQTRFMRTAREILPDEVFAGGTGLADLSMRLDVSPGAYLREGEIGAAALQLIKYGNVDLRFKQRMAYAWLKAQAVTNARRAGLRGRPLRSAVDAYLANPPLEDRAQAVAISNFELLNYADSPDWLEKVASWDYGKLIFPFPRFGYHFVSKNARRAAALQDVISRVPRERRADALADFLTFVLWPAGGLGIAGAAALRALGGKDDQDDVRELVGVSRVKSADAQGNVTSTPIDRTLVTANRINLSAWAKLAGLGSSAGDDDFWMRVRNYPVIAMAGAALLAESDARKYGPNEGAKTYLGAAGDLASDFFSLGMALKVPAKAWQTFVADNTQGRNPPPVWGDPYATRVPFVAYVTDQTLDSFVPGSRQADMVIRWVDPVPRRKTSNRKLGFEPGAWDAARVGHVTGLLDRLFAGDGGASTLPPEGTVDRFGRIDAQEVPLSQRVAELAGFNIRPVNRDKYRAALAQ